MPSLYLLVLSMETFQEMVSQVSTKFYMHSRMAYHLLFTLCNTLILNMIWVIYAGMVQKNGNLFTCSFCAKLLGHSPFFCASHLAQAAHHAESTSRKWIRLAIPLSKEGRLAQTVISEFASPNVTGDSASG